MPLPTVRELPPGCETVEFGRNVYVCDPAKPLAKGQRAAVWGGIGRPRRDEEPYRDIRHLQAAAG
jgi:hypothetical protein